MQFSTRALLFTRVVIVLNLVRGKNGVELVGEILGQREYLHLFCADAVHVKTWQKLHRAVIHRIRQLGESCPFISHREGLASGYSGIHPLEALRHSCEARHFFDKVVNGCYALVLRCMCKGFVVLPEHIIELWNAIKGKAPLAKRGRTLCLAARYTSMSLARVLGQLLCSILGRPLATYNESLHAAMTQGQSRVTASFFEEQDDVSDMSVFQLFGIENSRVMLELLHQAADRVQGMRCISLRLQAVASVTWSTFLAHLCEVKQCLKKWSLRPLAKIAAAVKDADLHALRDVRRAHQNLMQGAGGNKCHAVFMVEAAIRVLRLKIDKGKRGPIQGKRADMHKLILDMASSQLSPKLNLLCIPEWRAIEAVSLELLEKARAQTPKDICEEAMDSLRAEAVARGVRGVRSLRRDELLVALSSPTSAVGDSCTRARTTLQQLYHQVREEGGNPKPYNKKGERIAWNRETCRRYLLRKRPVEELRELHPPDFKRARKSKAAIIEEVLLHD